MELGAIGVCCQKVSEAEAMVYGGVKDVLVTNEIVGKQKLRRLMALAHSARIATCADDPAQVQALNEAAGEAGVAAFERDLEAWVTLHRAARYNGRTAPRIVLVSPIAHERLARMVHVDVDARNRELARYTEAMRSVASRLECPFVDVFTPMRTAMAATPEPLTINGIHLNEIGDRVFAGILMTALGFEPAPSDTSAAAIKAFDSLREMVRAKNQLWFYRFRPLNAEYVVGRRVNPFGSVNFPGEMKRLDERIAEQDQRIWRQARSVAGGSQ
jgi:hypothetical protein